MSFTFTNPETAANYECVFGVDKKITIQGLYSGRLSNITPEVAERMIKSEDNQVKRKTAEFKEDAVKEKKQKPEKSQPE